MAFLLGGRLCRDSLRWVTDQLRERFPKIPRLMDDAEDDVLAHMSFPKEHRSKIYSTNPLERLNGETKRRTDVVETSFPLKPLSIGWSVPCCSSRTTSGHCSVVT